MYNVTIISTEHIESGKCNSDELYKIIESIKPEVIFEEEVADERFHKYYNDENSFKSLEVQTVIKYLRNHNIEHVPIDIATDFNFKEWDFMFDWFKKYLVYKQILKEHCHLRDIYGFKYLNSESCLEIFKRMKLTERQLIEYGGMHKNELLRIYEKFEIQHSNREYGMIQNIYEHSSNHRYQQAVFLLGYAHRKSIMNKIMDYKNINEPKINWIFYDNTN